MSFLYARSASAKRFFSLYKKSLYFYKFSEIIGTVLYEILHGPIFVSRPLVCALGFDSMGKLSDHIAKKLLQNLGYAGAQNEDSEAGDEPPSCESDIRGEVP